MATFPCSPYTKTGGLFYFARMLDKIRLLAANELHADYLAFVGQGMDGRCTRFMGLSYDELKARTLAGGTDEEVLAWCYEKGRKLADEEILVWNGFISKRGWNDEAAEALQRFKAQSGLAAREDIRTLFEYFEVDEGRRA